MQVNFWENLGWFVWKAWSVASPAYKMMRTHAVFAGFSNRYSAQSKWEIRLFGAKMKAALPVLQSQVVSWKVTKPHLVSVWKRRKVGAHKKAYAVVRFFLWFSRSLDPKKDWHLFPTKGGLALLAFCEFLSFWHENWRASAVMNFLQTVAKW